MRGEAPLRIAHGWRLLLAGLLLAGLAACAGLQEPREEEAPLVSVPGGQAAGQAAEAEELPVPEAGHPEAEGPEAGDPDADGAEPVLSAVQPALGGVKPALGGQPDPGGASGGESAPGAALPVPRPPAEPKKPAGKTKAGGEPAKAAKAPAASAQKTPDGSASVAKPGAAAKPAAGQAPAAAGGSQTPAAREVLARKGDTVVIDLEGRGWLLLPGDRRGVSFLGSESGPQRTSFSFKALELGEHELAFQLQDNARGAATGEVVRLRVLPEEQFRELLAAAASAPPTGQGAGQGAGPLPEVSDPARLQKAERLFAGGFYDLALPEYLAVYRDADPLLNDRLAAIYLQKGEAAAAAKYYDRNLSSPPPFGRNAVVGLTRSGLAMGSPELVLQHLPALLELPPEETRAELLGVARFAAAQGRHALALDLLTQYLRRFPRGSGLDEAWFQLARLYELESPLRDVSLAREYYRKVYEEFPESEHAGEARTRILYLDRYFFHVQ